MKRAAGLLLIIFACVAGFLSIWRDMPFMPVFGFIVVVIVLLAILLYSRELSLGGRRLFRAVLSPVIQDNYRDNQVLSQRFEATERALDRFAGAMQLYAQHMASHTSAIQGLSEASQALKGSAAEQNRILFRLTQTLGQGVSERGVSRVGRVAREFERRAIQALQVKDELEKGIPEPGVARVVNEFERRTLQALKARDELEKKISVLETEPWEEPLLRAEVQSPPGCAVNPRALLARLHYYTISP